MRADVGSPNVGTKADRTMSQRRKTNRKKAPDASQETDAPEGIERSDDRLDHTGKSNVNGAEGSSWLERVKASAELADGDSDAPFFGSEPVGAEPPDDSPVVSMAQQVDLPWARPDESDRQYTPEPTQESAPVQMEEPIHNRLSGRGKPGRRRSESIRPIRFRAAWRCPVRFPNRRRVRRLKRQWAFR
jgi:hypothetical protein